MLEIKKAENIEKNAEQIDKQNNVLIIGSADSNINLDKILLFNNPTAVKNTYGDCRLSRSFSILKTVNVKHVFILNTKSPYDLDTLSDLLTQYNFSYVVFTDIYFSTVFSTKNKESFNISFAGALLERCGNISTTFIFTDKHASLYEDLDTYLEDMFNAHSFIKQKNYNYDKRNLIFVLNNLKDYELSNVILAGILASGEIGEYPIYNFGEAIFDIEYSDIKEKEMVYFKNNYTRETTIENLINFYNQDYKYLKIVFIDRIVKYLDKLIDMSEFIGQLYTPHHKTLIENKLNSTLSKLVPKILLDYEIENISIEKNKNYTVNITNTISIYVVGCLEKLTVVLD